MKQVRLLPVVIAAAFALLLLKGLGIMTNGGYVLVGTASAEAAGSPGEGHNPPEAAPTAEAAAPTMALPVEPTLVDENPTIGDDTPTLPLQAEAGGDGGHGAPAAGEHGAEVAEHGAEGEPAAEGHEADVAEHGDAPADATAEVPPLSVADACPPVGEAAHAEDGDHAAPAAEVAATPADPLDFMSPKPDCPVAPADTEHADAEPTIVDGDGNIVPLEVAEGTAPSEDALLERLADRRDALDARSSELDMRLALVEAAEKRIDERTAALEALEARINAMVDEKRTLEEAQFVAVVAMYETMKPKDAAAIFDQLEMPVLLRVARAVNPRKMAPIMARMNPMKAKDLTAGLAVDQVEPTIDLAAEDLTALPQIVGQ